MWECKCSCGKTVIANGYDLSSGHTTSCGCNKKSNNPKMATIKKVFNGDYADGNLTVDQFHNLSQMNCFYCGIGPSNLRKYAWKTRSDHHNGGGDFSFNGLDRVNNDLPHNIDNVITSCYQCNRSKGKNSFNEFIVHMQKLYTNLVIKNWDILPISNLELKNIHFNKYDVYLTSEQIKIRHKGHIKYTPQAAAISSAFGSYKANDKMINRSFDLTFEDFYKIVLLNCAYCNSKPKTEISIKNINCDPERIAESFIKINGLDRIDSNREHSIGNIVPSCYTCNWMKSNKSYEYFIDWIKRVEINLKLKDNI